jgi:hypothetical protein
MKNVTGRRVYPVGYLSDEMKREKEAASDNYLIAN